MTTQADVREALTHVLDGTVPANVVDPGLVEGIEIVGETVCVKLNATTPDPVTDVEMAAEARSEILQRTNARHVRVDMVHVRHWTPEMMNDEGRKALSIRADEG